MNRGIAILLLLSWTSCAVAASKTNRSWSTIETRTRQAAQRSAEKQFTPEEMIEDLDTLLRTLEEVHPDLYYYTPKPEIAALKNTLVQSLNKPLGEREFVQIVARLVAKFGDAHTNVSFALPGQKSYIEQGGVFFPFDIKETARGVLITRNYSDDPALSPGDRLLSINGVAADTLFAQLLNEVSGETLAFRTTEVEHAIKTMLWIHDVMSPYKIELESRQTGQRRTETVTGITAQALSQAKNSASGNTPKLPYSYDILAGGIGYLNFRSMGGDKAAFEAFLDVTFKLIKAERVKGLIVDLRENGGGNSALGESLLSYITNQPYKMEGRKEWKASPAYRDFLKTMSWYHPDARFLAAKDGEIVVLKDEMIQPANNPLRFDGPVCFLIGHSTFSSAMMVANAVGDFKLATLIGEETGDPPTAFGELYTFKLPHSQFTVNVSSAHFVRANGDATNQRPVQPDIKIVRTEDDLAKQSDPVLDYAKKWVLHQGMVKPKQSSLAN